MLKKILALLFFFPLLLNSYWILPAYAEGEFQTTYNIVYEVDQRGETQTTEQITLKNLTDKYYPSNFSLTIGATKINEVSAFDSQGLLPLKTETLDKKTKINVELINQQVVGKDKEYKFTLKFKTSDFTTQVGKIWQVSIPKINSTSENDNYTISVLAPVSFGDPSTLIPEPDRTSEIGGKVKYDFSRDKIINSGILINFGTNQVADFKLVFNLYNQGFLAKEEYVPIPPDSAYQKVFIKSIDPKPENIFIDKDGNNQAIFKLSRNQATTVTIEGSVNLYSSPILDRKILTEKELEVFKTNQKFWDKDSVQVKAKVKELLANAQGLSTREKAGLINNFIVDTLVFDNQRVSGNDFARLGGLAALNNPQKVLASEYTDLFVTLARAADIPARALAGYAYSDNLDLRPLSFQGTKLHTWPEYYDHEKGWIMIDPTWQATTAGVDYFNNFDLNHFVTFIRGSFSTQPYPLDSVELKFSDTVPDAQTKLKLSIEAPEEVFSGIPSKAKIKIENLGNTSYAAKDISFSAATLNILDPQDKTLSQNISGQKIRVPEIPALGHSEFEFNLRAPYSWQSFDDVLSLRVGEESLDKKITIKPIFLYKYFYPSLLGVGLLIILSYSLSVFWHVKRPKGHRV